MSDFELPKQVETKGKKAQVTTAAPEPQVETEETPRVNKPQFDQAELAKIFDEIIFSGVYSEDLVIKERLRITLKSRTAQESEEISSKLDATPANLITTLHEKRALLNIHYALIRYQGKDLSTMRIEEREKFVNQIPAPVINVIVKALAKFDTKVYAACEDGEENF